MRKDRIPMPSSAHKPLKILAIDDQTVILDLIKAMCLSLGYSIDLAENGEIGERMALENDYDLILTDLAMPGKSGIDAAVVLKELGIPAVFLSAYDDEDYVQQAVANGALGYMVKPIDVSKAIPTIESALQRARDLSDYAETEKRLNGALETCYPHTYYGC